MSSKVKSLGVFSLAMISVGAVLSVRNYPSMAIYGWSSIGWYILGTLLFLIPITLASAELATGWTKGGGVYLWVKEAFGEKAGFIAIFCEWSNNLVWFPTVLSFIAGTFAYVINPDLANNGIYMFSVMMIAFWGCTGVAWLGSSVTAKFNNTGVLLGSIIPSILLVIFGLVYIAQGQPVQLPTFNLTSILPNLNFSTLPFVATIVLLFAGMEMAGFHALEVKNPKIDFPKAMGLAAIIILLATMFGTLALAWVVPVDKLNLAAGVMQAFAVFLDAFHLKSLIPVIAGLLTVGGLALLINWLVGPVLGLGVTSAAGDMPPVTRRLNKQGVPTGMLLIQGFIATIVSLAYVFSSSVNQAYWILSALTVMLLCITYMLVFAAVIRLRITQPKTPRPFKIPGGMFGIWIVGGVGFLSTAFTFIVGCFPTTVTNIPFFGYVAIMLFGTAFLSLPPLVFMKLRKPSWVATPKELEALGVEVGSQ
ncbi:MAG: APC family permease [Patescibacteria group bacterium]|nr:APC family permease [Patescibacteria group bacterium]